MSKDKTCPVDRHILIHSRGAMTEDMVWIANYYYGKTDKDIDEDIKYAESVWVKVKRLYDYVNKYNTWRYI